MRFPFAIHILFLAIPLSGFTQGFGCYETPINEYGTPNVLDGAYNSNKESDFDNFKITATKDGYYKEYYVTRPWYPTQLKMEGNIVNGKKQGKWVLYLKDNSRWCSGNFIDGLKEGEWKKRFVNYKGDTIVYWTGSFLHDTLNGTVKIGFYLNGKPEEEMTYVWGLLNGTDIKYFEDGRVEEITNYQNDKKYGQHIKYEENGQEYISLRGNNYSGNTDTDYRLEQLQNYASDTLTGLSINTENGVSIENYVNGKMAGECTYYYPNGKFEKIIHDSNGLLSGNYISYYDNGNIQLSTRYSHSIISGEYDKYYNNGLPAYKIIFKDGLPYTSLYAGSDSGKTLDQGTLKNGEGTLMSYYSNGKLKSISTYKNNLLNGRCEYYSDSGHLVAKGELFTIPDTSTLKQKDEIDNDDIPIYVSGLSAMIKGTRFEEYYDDGTLKYKYNIVSNDTSFYNNCMHYYHYENGKIKEDYYQRDHYPLGHYISYYDNQKIESVENCKIIIEGNKKKSLKDGLCKYYFKSGPIKAEVYFSEGKESGHSKYYDEAGNLVREHYVLKDGSEYNVFNGDTVNLLDKNNHKQGKWISLGENYRSSFEIENDCNITPESIKYYKDGEPTGTWLFTNGDSIKLVWTDSVKAYSYHYDNNNDYNIPLLKAEGYMLDEYNKIGHWKEYNTDGKKSYLEWEGDYIYSRHYEGRDLRDGAWKHYKKNGKVKEIITYKNGEQVDPKPAKQKKSKVRWE